jgi:hypothetical protein
VRWMLRGEKKKLRAEVVALQEEVRELRRALEALAGRPSLPPPLPGEDQVLERMVDRITQLADERDDLARRLAEAKRLMAEKETRKPRIWRLSGG